LGEKVAFIRTSSWVLMTPMQLGPMTPHAVLNGNAHEFALHLAAGRAGLGEAGGDHHHAVGRPSERIPWLRP